MSYIVISYSKKINNFKILKKKIHMYVLYWIKFQYIKYCGISYMNTIQIIDISIKNSYTYIFLRIVLNAP